MRKRASAFAGLLVFAFSVAAAIPSPVAASAPVRAEATSAAPQTLAVRSSLAIPHQVDVSKLSGASHLSGQAAAGLPFLTKDPAALAAAKRSPKGPAGKAMIPSAAMRAGAGKQTATTLVNFGALTLAQDTSAAEPPDTQMAAGPTRLVEMVNSSVQVYSKSGTPFFGTPVLMRDWFAFTFFESNFFSNQTLQPTDPRVVYDTSTGRWYATILGYNGPSNQSGVFLAISANSDPTGVWNVYIVDIEQNPNYICDQPKLGYTSDKFLFACSEFDVTPTFQGAILFSANKAQGLAGLPMYESGTNLDTSRFGVVPAQNLTSGPTGYMIFNENPGAAAAGLVTVTGVPSKTTNSVFSLTVSISIQAATAPPSALQLGGPNPIDTSDGRFNSAFVQGGVLYTSGGEACAVPADAVRACARVLEIGLAGNTVLEDSLQGIAGMYMINPTIGVNANGDIVMGYSTSSATTYADFEVATQPAGDFNDFFEAGALVAGTGPYISNTNPDRWGDYGAAAVDPSISADMWVGGEFSNGPTNGLGGVQWATQIAELNAHISPVCVATGLVPGATSPQPPNTPILLTASATCVSGATPAYQFWIKSPAPGAVLTMVQDYSATSTYNWTGQVTLGTYQIEVLVRASNETRNFDSFQSINFTISTTPCTTPTLGANPSSSPQVAGTPVLLTATTTCGTTPEYQFWVVTPDHLFHMVQDYSTTNTFNWTTLDTQIGNYTLEVLVKNTGSLGAYDAYTTIPYSMQLCNAPTLSTGAATSPYVSGSGAIMLTATGACEGTTQFEFWYQLAGKNVNNPFHLIGSGYGTSNTAMWNADYTPGVYTLLVELRPQGSSASYVTFAEIPFQLTGCDTPSALDPSPGSPQVAGTTVTWTATVSCTGTPSYKFYVQSPAGVWTLGHDWQASNIFSWSSPAVIGTYHVQVWVRNAGATDPDDPYDSFLTAAYSLALCNTPTLSTGTATSPYASGSGAITLTATGACSPSAQFEFWYKDPGGAFHLIGSGYGSSNTAMWNADYTPGAFALQVELRPAGSTASFVTYLSIPFTLSGCGSVTMVPDKASPQIAGTLITWTATVACSGTANYQFWVAPPGGGFAIAQPWSATNTFAWTPNTLGTYSLQVWVRNSGAAEDLYDHYQAATFTIGLCSTPTLSTGAASSPYSSGAGAITLTATGACTGGTQFEFWYKDTAGVFHLIGSGYGASNTAMWNADFKPGIYSLQVELRPVGSSASFVSYLAIPFTLTGCTVLGLTPDLASPQSHTQTITWTANATCTGAPSFQFYVAAPGAGFVLAQAYGSGTFSWTTHAATGVYTIQVWVRNSGANEDPYDLFKSMTYKLT